MALRIEQGTSFIVCRQDNWSEGTVLSFTDTLFIGSSGEGMAVGWNIQIKDLDVERSLFMVASVNPLVVIFSVMPSFLMAGRVSQRKLASDWF